jgi:hemolysin III
MTRTALEPSRGLVHELGFHAPLGLAAALFLTAEPGRARAAAAVFSSCVAACFGSSPLYHQPTWTPSFRAWLARLDHAGIYLLIAGTYTPFGLIVMSTKWAAGAVGRLGRRLRGDPGEAVLGRAPKWLSARDRCSARLVERRRLLELLAVPVVGLALLLVGGVLPTAGAIVYVRRSSDPVPDAFGYHELFHLLTLAAAACQYASIALFVLPRA